MSRGGWRLQFTICELVLLTAAVATTLGFWLDHRRQSHTIESLKKSNQDLERQVNRFHILLEQRRVDEQYRRVVLPQRRAEVTRLIEELHQLAQPPAKINPADYNRRPIADND